MRWVIGVSSAAVITASGHGVVCPGQVDISGFGKVWLTSAHWNVPAQAAGSMEVLDHSGIQARMSGRGYLSETCVEGEYSHDRYLALKLLGRRIQYTTDISGAGCGCNAALYLVSMQQNTDPSNCKDYYADANKVCGVRSAEIDLQEANLHAWRSTIHASADGAGLGGGFGGGNGWNGPRDWAAQDYGPNGRCVNTNAPFQVEVSFRANSTGNLLSMDVVLSQVGTSCTVSTNVGHGYGPLEEVSQALRKGMTPVISYWSSNDMLWLDGTGSDGLGGCAKDRKDLCGESVRFYDFSITDIDVPPTTPSRMAPPHLDPPADTLFKPSAVPAAISSQKTYGMFQFVGFHDARDARDSCGNWGRLAMPKNDVEQAQFLEAIAAAKRDGHMSDLWPFDTVWVGGHWSAATMSWQWDDGVPIVGMAWGPGQPSAKMHQELEPYLCVSGSSVRDSGASATDGSLFKFAVFCEADPSAMEDDYGEDGYCCEYGYGCGDECHKRSERLSFCGRSSSNCEQCLKYWCQRNQEKEYEPFDTFYARKDGLPNILPNLFPESNLASCTTVVIVIATLVVLIAFVQQWRRTRRATELVFRLPRDTVDQHNALLRLVSADV